MEIELNYISRTIWMTSDEATIINNWCKYPDSDSKPYKNARSHDWKKFPIHPDILYFEVTGGGEFPSSRNMAMGKEIGLCYQARFKSKLGETLLLELLNSILNGEEGEEEC